MNWNGYLIWKTLRITLSLVCGILKAGEAASWPSESPQVAPSVSLGESGEGKADSSANEASSVMLSSSELDALGLHVRRSRSRSRGTDIEEWRLDGIIFRSQEDWVLWLNGEMYTPKDPPQALDIISVAPGHIDMKLKNQGDDKIRRIVLNQKLNLHR